MTLGDHFPESLRKPFCDRNLQSGAVFKLQFTNTTPPKEKRIILLGIDTQIALAGYVFINTKVNMNVFHNSELQQV